MLILGIMHIMEVHAVVIQKMMVPFLKINFDTILTGLNITHGMTNRPHDIFLKQTHITKTYACRVSHESSSCIENEFAFTFNIYDQFSDSER